MNKKVSPIPTGYQCITPYLLVSNANKAIEFYKTAFGAVEMMRSVHGGKVCHAELKLGDSMIMLADEFPEKGYSAPKTSSHAVTILFYTEDVDAVTQQAINAGATIIRPLENMFYGDRSATLQDPFGHMWNVATHIEDVSDEETSARIEKLAAETNM